MASGHEIAMGLRAAYWAMHRRTDALFAKRGVTADQFVLLALLAEQDGITQQDLVRRASSDANTIRAMLVLLESRGLVARGQHPTDRRARSVTMTRKGRQTHERLWAISEPLRERLVTAFRPGEADVLVELLAHAAETMAQTSRRGRQRSTASAAGAGRQNRTTTERRQR
jgi:DNA-binding MarR family transcriptional regulator